MMAKMAMTAGNDDDGNDVDRDVYLDDGTIELLLQDNNLETRPPYPGLFKSRGMTTLTGSLAEL